MSLYAGNRIKVLRMECILYSVINRCIISNIMIFQLEVGITEYSIHLSKLKICLALVALYGSISVDPVRF